MDNSSRSSDPDHALVDAILRRDLRRVRAALEAGADANSRKTAPLSMAAPFDYPALIQALIQAGADVHGNDPGGQTPLMIAAHQDARAAAQALLEAGADVNREDAVGNTALHYAVAARKPSMTRLLLRAGADPLHANQKGVTPAGLCLQRGNAKVLEVLLRHGLDPRTPYVGGRNYLEMGDYLAVSPAMKELLRDYADAAETAAAAASPAMDQ